MARMDGGFEQKRTEVGRAVGGCSLPRSGFLFCTEIEVFSHQILDHLRPMKGRIQMFHVGLNHGLKLGAAAKTQPPAGPSPGLTGRLGSSGGKRVRLLQEGGEWWR